MFSEVLGGEGAFQEPLFARFAACARVGEVLEGAPPELPPDETNRRRQVMEHLLAWGGMPELLRLDDAERREWLRSYEVTYLERDLGDLARLADLAPFRKFQRLTALRTGSLLSYSELARDGGFSVDTARRYLEYLRVSYQAFLLPPYHVNLTSQVVKSPKVFWADVGLARQVGGLGSSTTGALFETFVVGELNKWIHASGSEMRLFYYRTRSGLEADVLIETANGVIGIEIKMREKTGRSDAAGLRRVAEGAGSRWLGGLVVHGGTRLEPLSDPDIWSVPAIRLLG
jgi:predicted AAA+ superfamily ATPase